MLVQWARATPPQPSKLARLAGDWCWGKVAIIQLKVQLERVWKPTNAAPSSRVSDFKQTLRLFPFLSSILRPPIALSTFSTRL